MSTSNSPDKTKLQIHVKPPDGADPEDVKLIIYNGSDDVIYESEGDIEFTCAKGLYTIRWQYGDVIGEQVIRLPHEEPINLNIQRYSPVPFSGTVDAQKEYERAVREIRTTDTGAALGIKAPDIRSRLFLFIRTRNKESYRGENLSKDLFLVEKSGRTICPLSERSQQDSQLGYLACSLPASPGIYFLEYRDDKPRDFPLAVFPNWHTDIYILNHMGQPILSGASLVLSREWSDASYNTYISTAVDIALSALQNKINFIPREIERVLLYQKFDNPLLGLLGLHLYLNRQDVNPNTTRIIFGNLNHLIEGSTDVDCLRFKAALKFKDGKNFPIPEPVKEPPLLRASINALLDAQAEGHESIAEESLLENLLPHLSYDSPWATWHPLSASQQGTVSALREAQKAVIPQLYFGASLEDRTDNWLWNSVTEVFEANKKTGRELDWGSLAKSFGVSRRKVDLIVNELKGL